MQILRSVAELREWRDGCAARGEPVSFVPTMGFLHRGHQRLMQVATQEGGRLLVSIFVNPLQFGVGEDLESYPRDEAGDLAKIAEVNADAAVFLPSVTDMYPPGFCTSVEVQGVTEPLCGRSRPGHFKGVTTVVARLFGLARPTRAYFGQKDYQQLATLRVMVRDLAMSVQVFGVPTVREADGLALSSRNSYLTVEERRAALCLSRGLAAAQASWGDGHREAASLVAAVRAVVEAEPLAREDYVEALDALTLTPPSPGAAVVVALAVYVGRARLIDNCVLEP